MGDKPEDRQEPNFIIIPTVQPTEAVELLLKRFPLVLELGEPAAELVDSGPYYTYGIFAREAMRRVGDPQFLAALGRFIDELADSSDSLLTNVLVTAVLEELAADAEIVAELKSIIGSKAREMLDVVERDWYGRITDAKSSK